MDLSLPSSQDSTDSNCSADSDGHDIGKKLHRCNLCDYITNRRSNLIRHLYTMHQTNVDQGLECCEIRFPSKSHLKEHKKIYHADGYFCKICHRPFCRRALLKRHMNVHSGRKEFTCEYCEYATSHKSNLERHCQRLHGVDCSNRVRGEESVSGKMDHQTDMSDDFESSCEESRFSSSGKPRLFSKPYQCLSCDLSFHSQAEHSLHSEVCAISRKTSVDESVVLAALALTQLKYGTSFNSGAGTPSSD